MTALRDLATLIGKDLRIEGRSRRVWAIVAVLGLMIVIVLALGLGPERARAGAGPGAILWVAFLFGGALFFERAMDADREGDAIAALLLTPIDRGVLYASKLVVNLVQLIGLALVVIPAAVVFLDLDLSAAPGAFARTMAISLVGFAAVGTLISGAATWDRLPGGLLALAALPLSTPLILASTRRVQAVLEGGEAPASGDALILAFAVLFVVSGWLLFEFLLEP